jgi:predicted nuclease of restriction endonuclease-like (RecB) superfamily
MTDIHSKSLFPAKHNLGPAVIGQTAGKMPSGYDAFLEDLKARIRVARVKAALSVNRELITLYWYIGKSIVKRQRAAGWGKATVERLAADLQRAFPGIEGYSPRNIWRMKAFYLAWTAEVKKLPRPVAELDGENLPQPVAEIPWGHSVWLLEKIKNPVERIWYAQNTLRHGWSRPVLIHQIETNLYRRQGKAVTNFEITLPPPQSDLASQVMKDPYNFDFLTLNADVCERELEQGLVGHIRKFLLELGKGFAFVGSQYHLEIDGEDFYIDLLFYHLYLRCFIVIDLKMEEFKPEFAGKMNFYLSAADDLLRHSEDKPSIGIILCKTKKRTIVEYALRNTKTPIGVSEYRLTSNLPEDLRGSLPTIKELEVELGKV